MKVLKERFLTLGNREGKGTNESRECIRRNILNYEIKSNISIGSVL